MSNVSSRMGWAFPSKASDPWFDAFEGMVTAMDASGYAAREDRSIVVSSSALFGFTAGSDLLVWDNAIDLLSPISGFVLSIPAGSLTLPDTYVFAVTLVRAPAGNLSLAAQAMSTLPNDDSSFAIAVRIGGNVFFRTGRKLPDGAASVDLFGSDTALATNTSFGVAKLSVAAAAPTNPIMVGDNDPRNSNDRTASGLRSATTVVSVSGATAPVAGQALVATSGTAAAWQAVGTQLLAADPGGPTTGETWYNTTTNLFKFRDNTHTIVLVDALPIGGGVLTGDLTLANSASAIKSGAYAWQAASSVVDAGGNFGYKFNTTNTLTAGGAKHTSWLNNGTELVYLDVAPGNVGRFFFPGSGSVSADNGLALTTGVGGFNLTMLAISQTEMDFYVNNTFLMTLKAGALAPTQDNTIALGGPTLRWNPVYAAGVYSGNEALDVNSNTVSMYYDGTALYPQVDSTLTLGDLTHRWTSVWTPALNSGASTLTLTSGVAATGGVDIATVVDTTNALSATDKVLQIKTGGVEKAYITGDGSIIAGSGWFAKDINNLWSIGTATASLFLAAQTLYYTLDTSALKPVNATLSLGDASHYWTTIFATGMTTSSQSLFTSGQADLGANANAFVFNTSNTLTSTRRIASFQNNTVEQLHIDQLGNIIQVNGSGLTAPSLTNYMYWSSSSWLAHLGSFRTDQDLLGDLGDVTHRWGVVYTPAIGSGASTLTLTSGIAATGGVDIGTVIDTTNTLSSTDKLLQIKNGGTEKFYILGNGDLTTTTAPVTVRGGTQTETSTASGLIVDTPASWHVSGNMALFKNNGTLKMSLYNEDNLGVDITHLTSTTTYFWLDDGAGDHIKMSGGAAIYFGVGASVSYQMVTAGFYPQNDNTQTLGQGSQRWSEAWTSKIGSGNLNTNGHVVPNVADDTFALLAATQTLTNKTIDGASNTITNVPGVPSTFTHSSTGSGAEVLATVTPTAGRTTMYVIYIAMRDSAGPTGDSWQLYALFREASGTVTQISTTTTMFSKGETATSAPVLAISGANVTISGTRASTAKWTVVVYATTSPA